MPEEAEEGLPGAEGLLLEFWKEEEEEAQEGFVKLLLNLLSRSNMLTSSCLGRRRRRKRSEVKVALKRGFLRRAGGTRIV